MLDTLNVIYIEDGVPTSIVSFPTNQTKEAQQLFIQLCKNLNEHITDEEIQDALGCGYFQTPFRVNQHTVAYHWSTSKDEMLAMVS